MEKNIQKTVIISGGTSGIGKATALRLLKDGLNVVVFSYDKKSCSAFEKELARIYAEDRYLVVVSDVTKSLQMVRVVASAIKKYKKIDVVINNAGIGYFSDCDEIDEAALTKMVDVNVRGVMNLTAAVVRVMKRQKNGLIINIVSTAGKSVSAHGVFYGATKFAVMGYSEGIRRELKPFGIRVATLCPGLVKTAFLTPTQIKYRLKRLWNGTVPPMLAPDDIGDAISFICSRPGTVSIEDLTLRPF